MNERIKELAIEAKLEHCVSHVRLQEFADLILADMHKKVIASILITDVVMEAKGQTPTTEDYIRAIHKDFGVKEC